MGGGEDKSSSWTINDVNDLGLVNWVVVEGNGRSALGATLDFGVARDLGVVRDWCAVVLRWQKTHVISAAESQSIVASRPGKWPAAKRRWQSKVSQSSGQAHRERTRSRSRFNLSPLPFNRHSIV